MNETITYIDEYFTGKLPASEKLRFEQRCTEDEAFAREVSFYIMARSELKAELNNQKRKDFYKQYHELASARKPRSIVRRLAPYIIAAAASLLVFILVTVYTGPSAEKIADNYIEQKLTTLSVTMGEGDSIQTGIAAYNKRDYAYAETIFESIAERGNSSAEITEYLGFVYLMSQQYNEAIEQFDKLSHYPNLYANPGKFYSAVVRMKRSSGNDVEVARRLLQEVIDEKLPGHREASTWIGRL